MDFEIIKRIAEVKANERREALEEILYALVMQKFYMLWLFGSYNSSCFY